MTPGASQHSKGQPGIPRAALFGLCPRCGAKGLWAAPAQFAEACTACGQAFAAHEATGRSLYPALLPVIVLLIGAALWLDDNVALPVWALVLLWGALVPTVVVGVLRLVKVLILAARIARETEQ